MIYTGIRQTPEQIVSAAVQEDVDVIGLSCLSGAHSYLFKKVCEVLKEKRASDIPVIGGGVIPEEDIRDLKKAGIKEIFLPGSSMEYIVNFIKNIKCVH